MESLQIAAEAAAGELLEPLSEHISGSGDYSSEALAAALHMTDRYSLDLRSIGGAANAGTALDTLLQPSCGAALAHLAAPVPHWMALRVVDGIVWHLDSLRTPVPMSMEECRHFLREHDQVLPSLQLPGRAGQTAVQDPMA